MSYAYLRCLFDESVARFEKKYRAKVRNVGADRQIDTITPADANDFRTALVKGARSKFRGL